MLPPNPPPQRFSSISPQSGLPSSDSTGPFYRLFILDGTSWTANAVTPAFWPGPTPAPTVGSPSVYDDCNDYVIGSGDEGVIYTGAFANLQSPSPAQVEFGVAFTHNTPSTGFSPYMSVKPKPLSTPSVTGFKQKYGCFWGTSSPDLVSRSCRRR
jgi:hypothetical protein